MNTSDDRIRVGFLVSNGDFSRLVPATFVESFEHGVQLHVPYLIGQFPQQWFLSDVVPVIEPGGQPISSAPAPTESDYFDYRGSVGLVGCRWNGANSLLYSSSSPSSGAGQLTADFAIEGATKATNYSKINGFRSEIDGLGHWLNLWAHDTTITRRRNGGPVTVTTSTEFPPDIHLSRKLNLSATVTGTAPTPHPASEVRFTRRAFLQTYTKDRRDWITHIRMHRDIRDLLRIAVWKPIKFLSHQATSDNEKIHFGNNPTPQSQWREVRTVVTGIGPDIWTDHERPLFIFADIESTGLRKWLTFVNQNRRGIAPFLRLLDIRDGTIDEHVTQLGIAFEALGYQAFLSSGASEKRSDKKTLAQRIHKICDGTSDCLSAIPKTFAQDFADGYNAVKHANRPEPEAGALVQNYRLGVKIIRAWIALKIGVPRESINARLG